MHRTRPARSTGRVPSRPVDLRVLPVGTRDARPGLFKSIDEIGRIKGVTPAAMDRIRTMRAAMIKAGYAP